MDDFKMFTRDEFTGQLSLTLPVPPEKASGMDKLIQVVYFAILNDPGRSAFNPQDGSGLQSLLGSNISSDDSTEVLAEVSEKIDKIEEEILEAQIELEDEDPSARLRELIVVNIDTGVNIDEILLKLKVISEAGDESNIVI